MSRPTIVDAIADRALLGALPALHDLESWKPWLVFLRAVYGLRLDAEGEALFCRCTGRTYYDPPPGGWREVACIVGRQAGKTRVGALLVAFEAVFLDRADDGELYALLLAQDWRGAIRAAFSYIRALLDASPILRRSVIRETTDTLDLGNGLRVATYPCRPAAIRGLRARVVVLDELAYFRSGEGVAVDAEMLRAVRPTLATTGGRLIVLSSPYAQSGALFDLHRRHHGRDDAPVLVWQADAPTMNPMLPADYLARMREDDPEAFRSEVLGEFRSGLSTLFDPDRLEACVARDRRDLPPAAGLAYSAFVDPSGGRSDAFAVAIAHRAGRGSTIDVVRAWPAPFSPAQVVRECAEVLKQYGVDRVTGDRYGGEWPREAFRVQGIHYELSELDRSALYLEALALVNAQAVELPDDPALLRELRALERRTTTVGRDRVDHPRGAHDDRANVVAGVLHATASRVALQALEARDPVLSLIDRKRQRLYAGLFYPLSGPGPGPYESHFLDAAMLRRRFELGIVSREEYEAQRERELPIEDEYVNTLRRL